MTNQDPREFERAVSGRAGVGLFSDLWHFLRNSKKWWLLPIIVLLFVLGVLVFLGGGAAAPFIYTLF